MIKKSGNKKTDSEVRARKGPYRKGEWAIEAEKHRKILRLLRGGMGIGKTARIVGVGTPTVIRRKAIVESEMAKVIADEDGVDVGDVVEFRQARRQCELHGLVTVWPCVQCTSLAAKKNLRGTG